jgi:hypothetical protein
MWHDLEYTICGDWLGMASDYIDSVAATGEIAGAPNF